MLALLKWFRVFEQSFGEVMLEFCTWWTGMGFSLVNCFLGKADFELQHVSSWRNSVKLIKIWMCFSKVYVVHQKRPNVDSLIWVRSWAPHSLAVFLFVPEQIFLLGKLSFWFWHMLLSLAKQKCQISVVPWWNLFSPFLEKFFLQYSCHCSDNKKDTFNDWNKLALHQLLGKALCRWP